MGSGNVIFPSGNAIKYLSEYFDENYKLKKFAEPYYTGKDIMHNMWHIELVEKWINRIVADLEGEIINE